MVTERKTILQRVAHQIVAFPAVYNFTQMFFGAPITYRFLRKQFSTIQPDHIFLDIGGGTGLIQSLLPPQVRYLWLDNDTQKLGGMKTRVGEHPQLFGAAISDATRLPLASGTINRALIMSVAHHIDNSLLGSLFSECMRVLQPDGKLYFLDPVWSPNRPIGKLLWHYDRGSYPRTSETLTDIISRHGKIVYKRNYAIYHEYLFACIMRDQLIAPHIHDVER